MNLVQSLPAGPLDIIGDIHGEYDALVNLLHLLGYDDEGRHPDSRTIVFVGDFCDRGPDSPAVLSLVEMLVTKKRAVAVLGNHEMNLLRGEAKDGSGWFFEPRAARDHQKYSPYQRASHTEKEKIISFLKSLPIALEREDVRVVHAAWLEDHIQQIRQYPVGSQTDAYEQWDQSARAKALSFLPLMEAELAGWQFDLEDSGNEPPFLYAHAAHDAVKQMMNPFRVLTSGVERQGNAPFFSSGKWRFAERVQWWNEYDHLIPVVVGHYWRRVSQADRSATGKGDPDLFHDIHPHAWHGLHRNVFCVDFSVGGRWVARKKNIAPTVDFKLAALQWPERILRLDDGSVIETVGFGIGV